MEDHRFSNYPPPLESNHSRFIIEQLSDWSLSHGLVVRPAPSLLESSSNSSGAKFAVTAPITLFPSLFPRSCYDQALKIQPAYNELYARIASDEKWLRSCIESLLEIDDFVAKLWNVHLEVQREGYAQELMLGLFRSDYMVHVETGESSNAFCLRQIEFNTIASSFGGLSSLASSLHQYLFSTGVYPANASERMQDNALPLSKSYQALAAGLASAHDAYGPSQDGQATCILFIVQEDERNVFDQRCIEYELHSKGIRTFRLSFNRVVQDTSLGTGRILLYRPPHTPSHLFEVTTVYFRAGYSPDEYSHQEAWQSRLHLERSKAIKCPSVLTQIAGCKKVQQVLATPKTAHLDRFLPNQQDRADVSSTFAAMFPLDSSEEGLEARKIALHADLAQRYVLKPQREGGGNNIYRGAIPKHLGSIPESQWPAYILMEMVEPPAQSNTILRNGVTQSGGVICELGIYGTCLWRRSTKEENGIEILRNSEAGYLLRTKGNASEEGGIAAGFGAIDSCCIIDE